MDVWIDVILTILKGWAIGAVLSAGVLGGVLYLSSLRQEWDIRPGSLDDFDRLATEAFLDGFAEGRKAQTVEQAVYDWRNEGVL